MSVSLTKAKELCTASEFKIVKTSFDVAKKPLSIDRLQQKIELSRKLRDKYRDLQRRQRLEARQKADPRRTRRVIGHDGTNAKVQLFQETLERYEGTLINLKTVPKSAKKVVAKKSSSSAVKSKKSTAAPAKRKKKPGKKKRATGAVSKLLAKRAAHKKERNEQKKITQGKASTESSRLVRKQKTFKRNRSTSIQAHVRSSGKRTQAKRDSKNK